MSDPAEEDLLESVTLQALKAAENGYWSQVKLCFDRRQELLVGSDPSSEVTAHLLDLDRLIYEKVRLARAAVGQILSEVSARRIVMDRFTHPEPVRCVGDRVDRRI